MRATHFIYAYSSWHGNRYNDVVCSRACRIGSSSHSTSTTSSLHLMMDASFIDVTIDRTTTTPPPVTTPLSPMTFAGQVEKSLLSKFPQAKIERVLQSWRLLEIDYEHREFVGNQQLPPIVNAETSRCYQHAPSFVPGLKALAWWDNVDDLPWAKSLSAHFPAIRDEFLSVISSPDKLQSEGNNIWAGALTTDAESYGVSLILLLIMSYILSSFENRSVEQCICISSISYLTYCIGRMENIGPAQ